MNEFTSKNALHRYKTSHIKMKNGNLDNYKSSHFYKEKDIY